MTSISAMDLVELLDQDHRHVEQLLARFGDLPPEGREEPFWNLVAELVRHEVAEEVVVYPAIRSDMPDADRVADARIAEQSAAEEKLSQMEKLDRETVEFTTTFHELRSAVLAHTKAEEETIFPLLRNGEDEAALAGMGERYEKAKADARPRTRTPMRPTRRRAIKSSAPLLRYSTRPATRPEGFDI